MPMRKEAPWQPFQPPSTSTASLTDSAASFVAADEATGGPDEAALVAHLYRTALGRDATALELSEWNALLVNGQSIAATCCRHWSSRVGSGRVGSAEMVALVGVMSATFEVT
ncbi:hypothetical protein ACFOHT_05015 [Massilia oculi]